MARKVAEEINWKPRRSQPHQVSVVPAPGGERRVEILLPVPAEPPSATATATLSWVPPSEEPHV